MSTDRWVVEPMDAASDLAAVREVDRNSFPHPWTVEMFQRELERRDISHVFVIQTRDATVVGYCAVWVVVDELHINNLAVGPRWRRHGAGTALLQHVMSAAIRLGARRATLEVRASNTAARHLYEQAGFRVTGVREGYYSRPRDDALVLWREFAGVRGRA